LPVNGGADVVPTCPPKTFYDAAKAQCCSFERRGIARDQGAGNGSCVDLAAPGRPSDCPANEGRCDDPLWKDLMTVQCPKTCKRCGLVRQQGGQQRGDITSEWRIIKCYANANDALQPAATALAPTG
jgi:hypothetical protein